jgi:hypothetical protein
MWRVRFQNGEQMYATALVVAAPAYDAGKLLAGTAAEAAALLSGISYVPTLVLASGYKRSQVRHRLDGFANRSIMSSGTIRRRCRSLTSAMPRGSSKCRKAWRIGQVCTSQVPIWRVGLLGTAFGPPFVPQKPHISPCKGKSSRHSERKNIRWLFGEVERLAYAIGVVAASLRLP